jgi:hypothetical protein
MERSEGDMSLKNPVTTPGIDPGTVLVVAQRLNHYATPSLITITVAHLNSTTFISHTSHLLQTALRMRSERPENLGW